MDCKVSFLAFCNLCEHLTRLQKVEQKKQKLIGFIEEWRREDPTSIYSLIRLLLPHLDNERENYGLKETRLAEMYISALALPRDSQDATSLRNWQQSKHKDFSDALYEVLKNRLGEDDNGISGTKRVKMNVTCSLRDVNELLDQLTLSGEALRDSFLKLTAKMSANEQKWLTRIILKCLRVGLPDGQVLKLIHPDAPAVFDVRMNLSQVVKIFATKTPPVSIEEHLQVKLFSPFRPMLAEREALDKSVEILAGPFYIEPKLDGERCQLHFCAFTGIFRYFSRQGTEYTYLYGRTGTEGSLTPKIVAESPFSSQVNSIILDGEMVVYDPLIDKILPFGTLKTSAGTRYDPGRSGDEPHPCLVIFDVVYWNGQSLLKWSMEERSKLLKSLLVRPLKGYFERIERSELMTSTSDITEALDIAVQDQVEGLILKDPQSLYVPAHRSAHWIKIKPEYVEGMCDDLDLVIMGAWYGRAGNIKASYGKANEFLCGVWNEDRSTVLPFVKIGSGYNSHEWSVLNSQLEPLLIKSHAKSPLIAELKAAADRPDLIVSDPHRSVVIQVKGSQIVASSTYRSLGLSLRFPRFIKLRLDRAGDSSLKISELMRLKELTAGTLAQRASASSSVTQPKKQSNRPKGKMAMAIERTINSLSLPPDENNNVSSGRHPFDGYSVLILNGSDEFDKIELEQKVNELGGKLVQSPPPLDSPPSSSKFFAIAGKDCGIRVKNLRALQTVDIIDSLWLLECVKKSDLVPFKLKHFFFLTEGTRLKLESTFYVIETNEELKQLLKEVSISEADPNAVEEICKEFRKFSIELPKCSRGSGQLIPISEQTAKYRMEFEKLRIEYTRAKWI